VGSGFLPSTPLPLRGITVSGDMKEILVGWEPTLQLRMLHRNDKMFVTQAASPPCMTYA
jgi:hypothetical protein